MTLNEKLADSLRDCIRSLNIAIEYNGKIGNPGALRESATRGEEVLAEHRAAVAAVVATHDLYKDGDAGLPSSILDANGQVVLGLCKRCGRGEVELSEPCVPRRQTAFSAEALTDTYVQDVPDRCDRILWRGRYFHLPLQAPQPSPFKVVHDGPSLAMLQYLDGRVFCLQQLGKGGAMWGNADDNDALCAVIAGTQPATAPQENAG